MATYMELSKEFSDFWRTFASAGCARRSTFSIPVIDDALAKLGGMVLEADREMASGSRRFFLDDGSRLSEKDLQTLLRFRNSILPSSVPPEILVDVFAHVLRGEVKHRVARLHDLAQVCRSWWHLVLESKTLWAAISNEQPPGDVALALTKTGILCPLDISIRLDRRTLTAYTRAFLDIAATREHARRWRSFSVDVACHSGGIHGCSPINVVHVEAPPTSMDALHFKLHSGDSRTAFYAFPIYNSFHVNEVHMDDYFTISWDSERFTKLTVLQLTHLGRKHPSPGEIHSVLVSSPHLERLCFMEWCPEFDDEFSTYYDEHEQDNDTEMFTKRGAIHLPRLRSLILSDIPTYISRAISSHIIPSSSTLNELIIDDCSAVQITSSPAFVRLISPVISGGATPYARYCAADKQLQISSFPGSRKTHLHAERLRFALAFQFRDTTEDERDQVLDFFRGHLTITTLVLTCPMLSISNLAPAHLISIFTTIGPTLTTILCDSRADTSTTLEMLAAHPELCPNLRTIDCSTYKGDWNGLLLGMKTLRFSARTKEKCALEALYVAPGAPLFAMEPLFPQALQVRYGAPL